MGVIYELYCKGSGKSYIGQTKHTAQYRWNQHVYEANNPDKVPQSRYLNRAINKYGRDDWVVNTLVECPNEELNDWEIFYIDCYGSLAGPNGTGGYNLTCGGGAGHIISEETREYQSQQRRGMRMNVKDNRKVTEANALPRYVRLYRIKGIELGYKVADHHSMNGVTVSFTSTKLTMEQKLADATEFVRKLESGELVIPPNEVEPGIFKIHLGYRVSIEGHPVKEFVYKRNSMPKKLEKAKEYKTSLLENK